ncbi:hypothetical protein BDW66DRAFT_154582 [Aspergillus desertorum]
MDGAPTGSVHKKRHNIFGHLRTVLTGRSRDEDTRLITPGPSLSNTTANPDAPSSTADPNNGLSQSDDHDARDHWQMAYDELTESDRNTLATLLLATPTKFPNAGRLRTREILDQVVRATETRYKEDQTRQIRETAHKILDSALSFQDVVSNAVKFDPTGSAGCLFDSSAYLADLLARCAFVEEQFYRGGGPVVTNAEKRQSVVRVYVAILRYSAEVRRAQQFGKGKDIVESITAATSQHLAQLKTSIKEEESHLHHWLLLDQHLHRKAEAESILTHIDELLLELKKVKESVTMLNLPFAKGALFDSYADQREAECLPGTRTELLRQVKDWAKSSKRCIFWLSGMAVIVVDALDECEREEDVEIILELLPKVEKATGMVIRFFLTSQPESPIRFGFDQIGESGYENTILQNLDDNVIKHDITFYFRDEFSKIRWKRRRDLPPGWPGEERIEALATTAVPLFIFAATVCRFVADKDFDPEERLREFSTNSTGSKMDDTYRPVLNQLLVKDEKDRDKLIEEFQKIIGVVITLASPLSLSSLAELLETPESQISIRLDLFHSVLTIPDDPKLPIRTLHLSSMIIWWMSLLASSSDDKTIKLWDPANGALKHTLEGHSGPVRSVVFSQDGRLLTSGSDDKTIKLWDPATDGQLLASGSGDATIKLWDPATGALKHTLESHSGPVRSVIFSKDGHLLASSSDDNAIKLWDPAIGALKHTLEGHSDAVGSVAFSPDGQLLASGSHDGTVKLGILLPAPSSIPWKAILILASGSHDDTINLWDLVTGALKDALVGHSSLVLSVAFSPDGHLLASGSCDRTIKLWESATGAVKPILDGHSRPVQLVSFSKDGHLLASSSDDNTIKLWDTATGALKHTLESNSGLVLSVTFSQDGQHLASGSSNNTIKLWDPAIGALKHTLEGHLGWVWSVAFSPDGQLLAFGSRNGTIKLWDSATSALKYTISIDGPVRNIEFSKDLPQLNTNLGTFNIQVCYKRFSSHPSGVVTEAYLQGGRWVTFQGQKELWLPPDYQPNCSTSKDGTIALGCADGRAVMIAISTIGVKG